MAYGLALGLAALLAARLVWGFAYGVLNVTTTAYAIGDGQGTGRRVGLNRAVGTVGPAFALSVEGVAGGGAGTARGVPRPWRRGVAGGAARADATARGRGRVRGRAPVRDSLGVGSALLAAGLLLALQRVAVVVLSLVAGPMIDRLGARRLLAPCIVVVVAGLVGMAHGIVYPAAVAIVVARAFLSNVGPVLATRERSGTTVERLAAFATWVDSGLAVGPLIGGFVVARLGLPLLYDALAVAITVALVAHRLSTSHEASRSYA